MIDQKQLQDVEYFNYIYSTITHDVRCRREIKYRISMEKVAFNTMMTLFTSKFDLNLIKKLVKCYTWTTALYGAEYWTQRKVDQK
jgi:hypothetical protein